MVGAIDVPSFSLRINSFTPATKVKQGNQEVKARFEIGPFRFETGHVAAETDAIYPNRPATKDQAIDRGDRVS